jgi:hypothetical protein
VRDPKGRIRYAVLDDTTLGTLAERTVIELDRSIVLPETVDPVQLAAAMNPLMSSWVALRRRIEFQPGQRVLVLDADATCTLDDLSKAADVDVVLDYVWGEPAVRAMVGMLTARADRRRRRPDRARPLRLRVVPSYGIRHRRHPRRADRRGGYRVLRPRRRAQQRLRGRGSARHRRTRR